MILAETIQFTPEQERALMTLVVTLLVGFLLFVLGFFLSVVAGVRAGADPTRTTARVYWAAWIVIEVLLAALAVSSGELIWIGIVGAMLAMTGGAEAFGRMFRRDRAGRDPGGPEPVGSPEAVSPDPSTPAGSRRASRDRGAPGSRP